MSAPAKAPSQKEIDEAKAALVKLLVAQQAKKEGLQPKTGAGGKSAKATVVKGDDNKHMLWTVKDYDVFKTLKPRFAQSDVLDPAGAELHWIVTVELSNATYRKIKDSGHRLQEIQDAVGEVYEKSAKMMDQLVKKAQDDIYLAVNDPVWKLKEKDAKAEQIAQQLMAALVKETETSARAGEKVVLAELQKMGAENKELKMWYFKSATKITGAVGTIVGSAGAIAGSFGTASPVAVFTLTRGIIGLGQEVVRLSLSANQRYAACQAELATLRKMMSKVDSGTKNHANSVKELIINVGSKTSGIEVPSIKNFKTHVNDYRQDVTKLHQKLDDLGIKLNKKLDEQGKFEKELAAAKLPEAKRKKVEAQYKKVIELTADMPARIAATRSKAKLAEERYAELKKISDSMQLGIADWVKFVDPIVGAALDVGLAFAEPHHALPEVLEKIEKAEKAIEMIKIAAEVIIDELEEASD